MKKQSSEPGAFLCYISASMGKQTVAKLVQLDRHAVERGIWGLVP